MWYNNYADNSIYVLTLQMEIFHAFVFEWGRKGFDGDFEV